MFSRHHIEEVFFHRFSLNGYPYKVQHSDWFAGKLVGLAVIHFHGLVINAYVTHVKWILNNLQFFINWFFFQLHANYSVNFLLNQHSDEYLAHRIIQLFELSQFISKTGVQADVCLLLGDLNTLETEFGYKMLRNHAQLLDAYTEKNVKKIFFLTNLKKFNFRTLRKNFVMVSHVTICITSISHPWQ